MEIAKLQGYKGMIGVYKPKGPSSHRIINLMRRLTGEKKVGHAGTLDPLASGVLVIAVGREHTKQIAQAVKKEKQYLAVFKLGVTSTTDDEEGEKTYFNSVKPPSFETVKAVLESFTGEILQKPPLFSAVKIQGKPAYKLARKGKTPELKQRPVVVQSIKVVIYSWPILKVDVVCGPGVYIRSLARDIGEKLGTGAYMTELERIRVGEFTKDEALQLENVLPGQFGEKSGNQRVDKAEKECPPE